MTTAIVVLDGSLHFCAGTDRRPGLRFQILTGSRVARKFIDTYGIKCNLLPTPSPTGKGKGSVIMRGIEHECP
jgi:hypothetical protein